MDWETCEIIRLFDTFVPEGRWRTKDYLLKYYFITVFLSIFYADSRSLQLSNFWFSLIQEMGIPVVADLPVGYNLMDHVSAGAVIFLVNDTVSIR